MTNNSEKKIEAIFMQFEPDGCITRGLVNQMFDILGVEDDAGIDFLHIEGEGAYAVGIILEDAFNRIDFNCNPQSPYFSDVRAVLDDIDLETEDQMYNFCGIQTMIIYPESITHD